MAGPLVSVAMITYNHRPYIEKAVETILSQRIDFGLELVIGEDCSTDGTREVVLELQRRYPEKIRTVTTEKNVGVLANLVRTEKACRGKYVAYCEGDDFWNDPQKLARQVAFLEARPDYIMVHSHCHRFIVARQTLLSNSLIVPRDLDDEQAYEDILRGRRSPLTVTVVVRREALFHILDHCPECSDSKWPMGDTQRWLELARLGKMGCIHEPLATTNVLPESAGQSKDAAKRLRFYLAARSLQLHYLKKYPLPGPAARAIRENLALILLQHAYNAGNPEVASELHAEYLAQGGRSRVRAKWLLWGSRSASRRKLLVPVVKLDSAWRRVIARCERALGGPGRNSQSPRRTTTGPVLAG